MASGQRLGRRRVIARFASMVVLAGALAGCGGHGNQPTGAGGAVAAGDETTDSSPTVPTAHRIRLPLSHHNIRHRHAGPR